MKEGIHPKYYPEATVTCACGNTWTTGGTQEVIRTDVCSNCHPFFTGEQRIVDTAGQVERFMRRLEKKVELTGEAENGEDTAQEQAQQEPEEQEGSPKED
ncbi:MAG: 50S ribosomal protein L31 [Anaerolineae bacterium]|jgi:large subunit ribosomal protein L31